VVRTKTDKGWDGLRDSLAKKPPAKKGQFNLV
jgi:hypothetical protein